MTVFCFKCGADLSEADSVCPVCGTAVNRSHQSGRIRQEDRDVSFGDRAASFGIDALVLLVVWYVLFRFFYTVSFYLLPIIFVAYFIISFGGRHGATFGQRCLKIRVVDTKTGEHPAWIRAILRGVLLVCVPVGCLFYFVCKGRMLQDILSGTRVVYLGEK